MASAALAVHDDKRDLIARGWIINKRDDLIWFIGSVVVSYAFLAANLLLVQMGMSVMVVTWVWALGFDGPHVFGTLSRTYADREERQKRAKLFYGSLLLFLLGPAMVMAGDARLLGSGVWRPAFFFFASLWAYYHLVKQHYGFMVLYKKKNNDLAEIDNLIDRALIMLGMTYPLLHFMSHSVGIRAAGTVPLPTQSEAFWWFETLVLSALVVVLILFVGRQAERLYQKLSLNAPKIMLLAAAIPMHWIVLRSLESVPNATAASLAVVSTLTIYHNIQYHRIIWFHNRNKYGRAGNKVDYGFASVISKTVWRYIGFALVFGAAYHIPHYTLFAPDGYAMAFFWGGAFIHYYLDSKIWRVRRDAELNKNLRLPQTKPTDAET